MRALLHSRYTFACLFAALVLGTGAVQASGPAPYFGMNNIHKGNFLVGQQTFDPSAGIPSPDPRYTKATALGASWNRWVLFWYDVEQYNGSQFGQDPSDCSGDLPSGHPEINWNWQGYDALRAADAERGIGSLIVLQGVPVCRQATSGLPRNLELPIFANNTDVPPTGGPPSEADINPENHFAFYVYRAVAHFSDVEYWQVWNEVNDPQYWPEDENRFARLVEVTYRAARHANPEAKLVMPGWSDLRGIDTPRLEAFLAKMGDTVGSTSSQYKDLFDVYALHKYVGPWATFEWLHYFRTFSPGGQPLFDDKPVWLTETGVNVDTIGADERARYAAQLLSYFLALKDEPDIDIDELFHFQLDNSNNTGLLDGTTELPMYRAYDWAHRLLGDATFDSLLERPSPTDGREILVNNDHQEVLFTSPTYQRIRVMWSTTTLPQLEEVTPLSDTSIAYVVHLGDDPADPLTPVSRNATGKFPVLLPATGNGVIGGDVVFLLEQEVSCLTDSCSAGRPLDLAFLVDTTGSMWDDIANVRAAATSITSAVFSEARDPRVAVADFRDFPAPPYGGAGDYPYRLGLSFSRSESSVASALRDLSLGWGNDWPESVYSGLMGLILGRPDVGGQTLSPWRSDATKIILLIGDAPAQDPEPFTGFRLQHVLDAAAAGGNQGLLTAPAPAAATGTDATSPIRIYGILIGGESAALQNYSALAEGTGGKLFRAANASEVVAAILEAIGETGEEPENLPPDVTGATASVPQVWPPNNKMREIRIFNVVDPEGDPFTIRIKAITQDEPVSEPGNASPDGEGVGGEMARVRAERSGPQNGRVYRIAFVATDGKGAAAEGSVLICVPHDQGANTPCVDDGQIYDSTRP